MNVTTILTCLLVFGLSLPAIGQEDFQKQTSEFKDKEANIFETETVYGVGLYGGLLSGTGVGFRYHPAGRFGYQIVAGILSLGDATPFDVGVEAQFDFDARGLSRFYAYIGAGYYDNGETDDPNTSEAEKLEAPLRIGIGIAYEWPISSKMVFNISGAFTYFTDGTILPLPQAGIFYYFN